LRQDSLPLVATTAVGLLMDEHSSSLRDGVSININQRIGSNLLSKQNRVKSKMLVSKGTLQEEPAWNDFIVAIFSFSLVCWRHLWRVFYH
jgi:hypothetical protein